jgi:hypothetical protein
VAAGLGTASVGLGTASYLREKLWAGFAHDYIKAKLAQISSLANRLAEMSSAIEREQQRLDESAREERHRQQEELDKEMRTYRLSLPTVVYLLEEMGQRQALPSCDRLLTHIKTTATFKAASFTP